MVISLKLNSSHQKNPEQKQHNRLKGKYVNLIYGVNFPFKSNFKAGAECFSHLQFLILLLQVFKNHLQLFLIFTLTFTVR